MVLVKFLLGEMDCDFAEVCRLPVSSKKLAQTPCPSLPSPLKDVNGLYGALFSTERLSLRKSLAVMAYILPECSRLDNLLVGLSLKGLVPLQDTNS
jgi:hypothetical protein